MHYCVADTDETDLKVLHWVPVMLQEDDCVSRGEVEAQPPHMGRQQQHLNGGIAVEALHYAEPLLGFHTARYSTAAMRVIGREHHKAAAPLWWGRY